MSYNVNATPRRQVMTGADMSIEIAKGQSFTPIVRTVKRAKPRRGNKYALCRCGSRKVQAECCA